MPTGVVLVVPYGVVSLGKLVYITEREIGTPGWGIHRIAHQHVYSRTNNGFVSSISHACPEIGAEGRGLA